MKNLTRKINIVLIIIVCISSVLCGILLGSHINTKYFTLNNDIDIKSLIDDPTKIAYEGKKPSELSATECYLVAHMLLESKNYYSKIINGEVQTSVGVTQYTYSKSTKNDDTYYYEFSTHSSLIKLAGKTTFKIGDDITIQDGSLRNDKTIQWLNTSTTYSYKEYSELIGKEPTKEYSLIVSNKTTLSSELLESDNNYYTFFINLDPIYSSISYKKEMEFRSGIKANTINFKSITLKFTLDSNYTILSEELIEEYSMKYTGIGVNANTYYKTNYNY